MNKKKVLAFILCAVAMFALAIPAFAAEASADPSFSVADVIDPIKSAIFGQLSWTNIVAILVAGIAGSMAFVLGWFGFRKVKGMIMNAAKKGKLGG